VSSRASDAVGAAAPSYRVIGVVMAIAGVIAFSLRPVLVKLAYAYVADPVTLLALRMTLSLPFFVGFATWHGRRYGTAGPIAVRDFLPMIAMGFVGYYVASYLDFLGLQYVSAGLGRLLLFSYPTIVVMLSAIFLKTRIRAREIVALVLTYAGVALVMSNVIGASSAHLPLGGALVFASAIAFAIYLVGSSQLVQRVGSMRFTGYAMTVAALCCALQFLALRPLAALDAPLAFYGLAATMAIVCTVIPTFLMNEALGRIGANQVALLGALGPVSTIALGYLGLDEVMTAVQIAGGLLVLAGVLLVTIKPSGKPSRR
jgi:drug/metabolite transporter (DMT)-like permease